MTAILEQPAATQPAEEVKDVMPSIRRFTVAEYYHMAEAGILRPDERVELIEGMILPMSPKGTKHSASLDVADEYFRNLLGKRAVVRVQDAVHLDNGTEPEPDLVLASPNNKRYADGHPTAREVLFILEVSDSSLAYDRKIKGKVYARAGIPQYCILNLKKKELEDYSEPDTEGYRYKKTYKADETFTLVAFPDITVLVKELLPPE